MKNILIVGKNSFIGNSFYTYISKFDGYNCDKISVRNDDWKNFDFSKYDSVFYVTGIAHSDYGKISNEKAKEYYKINSELTIDVAKKVKKDKVKQFIFMSSIIVYGATAPIGIKKTITKDTKPLPINAYGDSKLKAEKELNKLKDDCFKVAIIRSPMVYGKDCKGNFKTLKKIAKILPIFPYIDNERSVIHIDRLCEFVKKIINENLDGVFLPQDSEYMNTSLMVKELAREQGKNIILLKGFTPLLKFFSYFISFVNKAFGNMVYEKVK